MSSRVMRIFRHHTAMADDRGAVVAIGNFDGVHRGHQAVIGAAGAIARAGGAPHAVLTFEPHPRSVFQKGGAPFRLTPFRMKARYVEELGVDLLFTLHFDLDFAARSAEDFVQQVLMEGLGVRHAVVGYDFVFGHGRRGTPALLRAMGGQHGFGVDVIAPVESGSGAIFSSTRIREHLAAGQPREAAALLGRLWEIDGRVLRGDQRGRTIGFPTANLDLEDCLRPAAGVYAVRAGIDEEGRTRWFDAVANLGWRPTFNGQDLKLEAHLFDFSGDLYGRHLRVAFVEYLRAEQRFAGIDALKAQIAEDARQARAILAATPSSPA
jgi:riboflavin kinase/FMN adenylyltransferase